MYQWHITIPMGLLSYVLWVMSMHCAAAVIFDLVSPGSNSKVSFKGKNSRSEARNFNWNSKMNVLSKREQLKPRENILWLFGP